MNSKVLVSGLILAAALATAAHAQTTVDVSKITCEQYVFSKVAAPQSIALWLSGYYSGKRDKQTLDVQGLHASAEKIEHFCRQQKNFKLPVMQAIEQVLGTGN